MKEQIGNNSLIKLFLHEKPFMLMRIIYYNNGRVYSALISKKIDCSYAYIVKLIKVMTRLGLTYFTGTQHKKTICLTAKGKKLFKLLEEAMSIRA